MSKIRMSCLILTLLLILSIGNWASAVKLSPNNEFGRTANSTENNAQTIVYVEPENVTANENETITIRVKVRNVTDLYGIEVQFCWNPSILKYVSHTVKAPVETYPDGILHSPVIIVKDQVDENASMPGAEPGTMYWLSCVSYLPADPFNGSGTVFEMTFQVVKEGACYLHIIYSQLADSAGNPITHKTRDGNFWSTPEPSFAPYANFTYSPERVFVNRTNVVFDASASYDPDGNITLYMWDFGDGTKINTTEPTIEHTYMQRGGYLATLTVKDNRNNTSYLSATIISAEIYIDVGLENLQVPASATRLENVTINVTLANLGDDKVTNIYVYVYYNETVVNPANLSQTVWIKDGETVYAEYLYPEEEVNLTITGNVTNLTPGTHFVKVELEYGADCNETNNAILSSDPIEIIPLKPKVYFTFSPRTPLPMENVVFDASASYDPDGNITLYMWDFGDGTKINTTEPTTEHTYITAGNYMVNLTAIDNEGYKNWTAASLTVSEEYYPLEVIADVGELHFKGEIAEFYILVLRQGEPCNTSKINAILYHEGKEIKTFTTPDIKTIRTGLYRIEYHIPANATSGTYLIYVEAYLQIGDTQLKGATIKSFQISPTLSNNLNEIKATLIEIKDGIGTINSTIGILKINLTEIKATLIEIKDGIGIINSTIGFLKADLTEINATATEVHGNLVKVQTTLGKVQDSLGTIQSIATYGIIAACIFSLIAAIVAILVLLLLKKKKQQT